MEQIAVSFTKEWSPATWLTPKVTILMRNWEKIVEDWVLNELGYWWYIYNFDNYNPEKVYLYMFDWWDTLDDYDRYKYWGNEFDAYTNKYSWGRTAAPYFTSINSRFNNVDKAIKKAVDSRKSYDDSALRKDISEIKNVVNWKWGYDLADKLIELRRMIEEVNSSVKKESSSKWVSSVNEKLDLLAEYTVKMKEDIANWLWYVGDNIMQWVNENWAVINEGVSKIATADQLIEQVGIITEKMQDVLDTFVRTQMEWILPKDITDRYDVNLNRRLDNEQNLLSSALNQWLSEWMNEGLNEGMEEGLSTGMEEWLDEWLESAREQQSTAPVDMQWIAEPTMPNQPL
jgi:hypothetical protein